MRNSIAAMLLGATFVLSLTTCGIARAQNAAADPYPYCQALELPLGAPSSPAVSASSAAVKPALPNLADLLKTTTDPNKIVDTMLDARAPLTPADYDALFQSLVLQIEENYVDVSKQSLIDSFAAKYRGQIKTREALDRAIDDLVQTLGDSATAYESAPDQLAMALRESIQNIGFFGANLKERRDGTYIINSITPGSTADLGGFMVGDTILSINGHSLKGLSQFDAEGLELSPIGNQLQVDSLQDGSEVDNTYMLQQNVPYNPGVQLLPQQVGYIKMPTQLGDQDVGAIVQALVQLQVATAGGMNGMVLDLRYVNAASVQTITGMLPVLLSQSIVFQQQTRQGQLLSNTSETISPVPDSEKASLTQEQQQSIDQLETMPLVVLVNASTTSAGAEQVAAMLREGRPNTTIVGEPTAGFGEESSVVELPTCGILSLATTRFLTPRGEYLGGVGVTPDVVVAASRQQSEFGDLQLSKAVQLVVEKSAYRPANLVTMDAPFIAQLGPAPKPTGAAEDLDRQEIAAADKTRVWQSLVVLAGLTIALSFLLVSKAGFGGSHPGSGGGSAGGAGGDSGLGCGRRSGFAFRFRIRFKHFNIVKTSTATEKSMIKKIGGFFGHKAVRSALAVVFLVACMGGLYQFAQTKGGLVNPYSDRFTYLTSSNAKRLLNLVQVAPGQFTASTTEPVLIVECSSEVCADANLDLAGITKEFKGKVLVLALDPYKQSKFAQAFEKNFVGPQVMQSIVLPLVQSYLQQQNQPLNADTVNAALQQPAFQAAVVQTAEQSGLMQPLYPRYLLFTPKTLGLVEAAPGLANKAAIESFVKDGLSIIAASPSGSGPQATAGAGAVLQPAGNGGA